MNGNVCEIRGEYLVFERFSEKVVSINTIGRVGKCILDKLVRTMRTETPPPAISIFEPSSSSHSIFALSSSSSMKVIVALVILEVEVEVS